MKCIVALGNPGLKYHNTRHNIGFLTADAILNRQSHEEIFRNTDLQLFRLKNFECMILFPLTYMNGSGSAVIQVVNEAQIQLDNLLIVFDDFQLPFGTLRLRAKGSDGGHKGIASIIYELQSEEIPRLRIGVGGKDLPIKHTHEEMADYVLSPFNNEEQKILPKLCTVAADACLHWIENDIAATMRLYNKNFFSNATTAL